MDLLFQSNNGNTVPGQSNISNILLPVPGKKIKSVEGFHVERAYTNITTIDNIITTVLNEVYLLNLISTVREASFNQATRLEYAFNFPPTFNPVVVLFFQGGPMTTHGIGTNQIMDILCSEFTAEINLGVAEDASLQLSGYKIIIEDI